MTHPIYLIAAQDQKRGIGKEGKLPWRLKKEMKFFTSTTVVVDEVGKQNMVIMGRNTWESIPKKYRPLPDRKNVVLTREKEYDADGAIIAASYDEALGYADERIENIYIIGGARVYEEALGRSDTTGVYLTQVDGDFQCDTFFPPIPEHFTQKKLLGEEQEGEISFSYYLYLRE